MPTDMERETENAVAMYHSHVKLPSRFRDSVHQDFNPVANKRHTLVRYGRLTLVLAAIKATAKLDSSSNGYNPEFVHFTRDFLGRARL